MNDLFLEEEKLLRAGQGLLDADSFESAADRDKYSRLFEGYRTLLAQVRRMVKISDRMEAELNNASNRFVELSNVDALTGLRNRRYFDAALPRDWSRAMRARTSIAVAMFDLDHFKDYNDEFGHVEGDSCLRLVGSIIADAPKRCGDWAARYGGEEFILCLPDTDSSGAISIAQRIAQEVAALGSIPGGEGTKRPISISAGIAAEVPGPQSSWLQIVEAADAALYRAKADGRNCIRAR